MNKRWKEKLQVVAKKWSAETELLLEASDRLKVARHPAHAWERSGNDAWAGGGGGKASQASGNRAFGESASESR